MASSSEKSVSIITLGCAKNTADTDNLARLLKTRGFNVVNDPAQAATIVVHTCSFIEAAKKESIEAILQAARLKEKGDKKLMVTGCLVQQHGQEIFESLPEVDVFLGTGQLAQVPDLIARPRARFMDRAHPGGFMDLPDEKPAHSTKNKKSERATAYLRLSEGCRHPCTFCVIPRLRGAVQSRTEKAILQEARALAKQGVEELVIIGQDTGDWNYGKSEISDQKSESKTGLADLLRTLAAIPGIRWIRLMYMHPASFTDDLLAVFADEPEKFPYLDMPLQHIDSEVLAQMKRKTDEAALRALLAKIRKQAPALALRTTFIVGFPGESDAQFERLLNFVKEGHFDYLGAFAYSQEEGTPAGRMKRQIPGAVKQQRLTALTNAHYDVAHAKAQKRLGTWETVLLEESEDGAILGRTSREAPDIDAVIRLPQKAARQGRFVTAKLTAYEAYEFQAELPAPAHDIFSV